MKPPAGGPKRKLAESAKVDGRSPAKRRPSATAAAAPDAVSLTGGQSRSPRSPASAAPSDASTAGCHGAGYLESLSEADMAALPLVGDVARYLIILHSSQRHVPDNLKCVGATRLHVVDAGGEEHRPPAVPVLQHNMSCMRRTHADVEREERVGRGPKRKRGKGRAKGKAAAAASSAAGAQKAAAAAVPAKKADR